MFKGKEKHV